MASILACQDANRCSSGLLCLMPLARLGCMRLHASWASEPARISHAGAGDCQAADVPGLVQIGVADAKLHQAGSVKIGCSIPVSGALCDWQGARSAGRNGLKVASQVGPIKKK